MRPFWIDHLNPIALSIGSLSLHWYALMYLVGIVLSYLLGRYRLSGQHPKLLSLPQFETWLSWLVVGGILGGRLGYVLFYGLSYLREDPLWVFKIWTGGMSFHGAIVGLIVVNFFYARRLSVPFLQLCDFMAVIGTWGLFFGRVGNFINGELWGAHTSLPWGVGFPASGDVLARHPSQLYEAFLEGIVLPLCLWILARKPEKIGRLSAFMLLIYGMFRIMVEFVREPDAQVGYLALDFLTMGQVLSLGMIVLSGIVFVVARGRKGFQY